MIAILKYNAGNAQSVQNAVQRLDYECIVTDDKNILQKADKVIFPGVGEASTAMNYLVAAGLDHVIKSLTQPVLGICLGMQLLCKTSEENNTSGLGIFNTNVRHFPPKDKVPHMGWNTIDNCKSDLFYGISSEDDVYFVHSFYAEICTETVAICDYILPFSAALKKDNFYGVQFHVEKSGVIGEQILQNFLNL